MRIFISIELHLIFRGPWSGVNATLDAVPLTCFLMLVEPPHVACCFCRFRFSVCEIRTFVLSSTYKKGHSGANEIQISTMSGNGKSDIIAKISGVFEHFTAFLQQLL